MGHTNSTANLSLPQFIGTDKPTWLGDINGAFSAIDSYAGTNDAAVAAAVSDASSAISQASAAVNTANTANTTAGNASTTANNAIGVANTANAIAGTVDAKVGLLADLNTTDRTSIVNAINEVNRALPGNNGSVSVTGDGVTTNSALLDSLFSQIDSSKISAKSFVKFGTGMIMQATYIGTSYAFIGTLADVIHLYSLGIKSSGSEIGMFIISTGKYTDYSSSASTNGEVIELVY